MRVARLYWPGCQASCSLMLASYMIWANMWKMTRMALLLKRVLTPLLRMNSAALLVNNYKPKIIPSLVCLFVCLFSHLGTFVFLPAELEMSVTVRKTGKLSAPAASLPAALRMFMMRGKAWE